MVRIALTFIFSLTISSLFAQFPNQMCVDSNRIDPFFQCNDPNFMPVCGCNFKTYRNECVAFRNYGVNTIQYDGVCLEDYLFLSIYPNTVTAQVDAYLQFYKASSASIQIRDAYGKLMFSQNYPVVDKRQFTFYVSDYRPGMYFMFVSTGGIYTYQRFVKL
ncbi:MAG: T9SS type A sorting domain-containing protein [Flavobacteriales bacterium]|nr:T9SS type A sorting domain-containing protein [Flavobacteriales bacterium]